MGKKNKRKKAIESETVGESIGSRTDASSTVRYIAIALLTLGAGIFLYASLGGPRARGGSEISAPSSSVQSRSAPPDETRRFRYHDSEEEARPFPVTLPPSHFRNEGIASTYRIAKEIPGVLAQQPCLCGCDNASDNHSSLLDCYIDEHASTCLVCMKEAVLAEQMTEAGASAEDIREAILRHEFSDVVIGN